MKAIKFIKHAEKNIIEREIPIEVIYDTISKPDYKLIQGDNRYISMKLYYDKLLSEEMLLRVVI